MNCFLTVFCSFSQFHTAIKRTHLQVPPDLRERQEVGGGYNMDRDETKEEQIPGRVNVTT